MLFSVCPALGDFVSIGFRAPLRDVALSLAVTDAFRRPTEPSSRTEVSFTRDLLATVVELFETAGADFDTALFGVGTCVESSVLVGSFKAGGEGLDAREAAG
jgi:hypothetical protein